MMQSLKHLTTNFESIPNEYNKVIQEFAKPHLESFNYMIKQGLTRAAQNIPPLEFPLPDGSRIKLYFKNARIEVPNKVSSSYAKDTRILPSECRLKGSTYTGSLVVQLMMSINDDVEQLLERNIGQIPIMVKSNACFLSQMTPEELIRAHEEPEEFGGYFIVNGVEKIIRMLLIARRNYPMVMSRPSWRSKGKLFSDIGVSIRCVAKDESASNMTLHYLTNGMAKLMISYKKELFFLPVMLLLKALCNYTDHEIYSELVKGVEDASNFKGSVAAMLRQVQDEGLYTQNQVLAYIGNQFRGKMDLPDWYSSQEIAEHLLQHTVCVHLESNRDKFNIIVFMIHKLYAAVAGKCALENPDNPMNHEVLLGGHLYLMILKEKLMMWLQGVKNVILRRARLPRSTKYKLTLVSLSEAIKRVPDLTKAMTYFLATGNVRVISTMGLMQDTGMCIVADRLNYLRFITHFRSVHRGSFFMEMRTTTVRKLLPESWGFICPVHTPDGAPCGLLNHLAIACDIVTARSEDSRIPSLLCSLGMTPYECPPPVPYKDCYSVILNGRVLGYIPKDHAPQIASSLRHLKVTKNSQIPHFTEICLVPFTKYNSQYPGLFLFTTPSRMIRPVKNLSSNTVEYIGVFEQVYLNISVTPSEVYPKITTHIELKENNIFSFLANLVPLPDFNQSPRNMYQCQMNKQTMGTPVHALHYRTDNKLYKLLTPNSPLFRTLTHDECNIDNYAFGTNAIVAVISYTGYDMEDAMVINKSSFERGFAHATVYKHQLVDLTEKQKDVSSYFGRKQDDYNLIDKLESDGFPAIGTFLNEGDPMYSHIDFATNQTKVVKYTSQESSYLQDVIVVGDQKATELQKVFLRFRIPRNPIVGDKFASRHGQKGICSQMYHQENMPFTESGITPDIIFNPHGFPSRMTIGMMIECMAGKSGALHGLVHDATPFKFSESNSAIDHFGRLLEAAGYNYYGTERMYSGIDGRELNADIFFGIVYYQRLRHMVADKFQVRSTGPVDILTRQPVKGRKRGGGIRFGEMERDSLIAHGTSFLLHDRLFNCSDRSLEYICTNCGGLLSCIFTIPKDAAASDCSSRWTCSVCDTDKHVELIALPFVFRYLAAELASVNIRVILSVK